MALVRRIEKLRAERDKNNGVVDLTPTAAEKAAIEKSIGRKVTNKEWIQGHLDRSEDRTFAQLIQDGNWKPIMPQQSGDPYAAAVKEAEDAVRLDQYKSLTPNEQRLFHLKELQLKKLQEAATEAEHKKRMAMPEVATALAELRELQNAIAFDPTWKVGEIDAITRAIIQLSTPNADLAEGFKMAAAATGIATSKQQTLATAKRQAVAELQAQIADLGVEDEESSDTTDESSEIGAATDPRVAAYHGDAFKKADLHGKMRLTKDYFAYKAEQEAAEPSAATE